MATNGATKDWTLEFQGAESRIYFGKYQGIEAVKKERFEKKYRLPALDEQLSRQRHRAEVRCFERLAKRSSEMANVMPRVLFEDGKRIMIMSRLMDVETSCSFISRKVKANEDVDGIFSKIGHLVGTIHSTGIIHGDLTTSNLLVDNDNNIIPIDFGLSSSSVSSEDRAVDLYVLERALQSTHVQDDKFAISLESYAKIVKEGDAVLKKLEEVRARGRKRDMTG